MSGKGSHKIRIARFTGAERTTSSRDLPTFRRLKYHAFVALLLMASASFVMLRWDVSNYIASLESVQGLSLAIRDVEVSDNSNPSVLIRFNIRNESPLKIEIESYAFELYLDGMNIGRSYSMYRGMDQDTDPGIYVKAQSIDRIVNTGETLPLEFRLYIYPEKMNFIRKTGKTGTAAWQVKSDVTVFLPYSRKRFTVRLNAEYVE